MRTFPPSAAMDSPQPTPAVVNEVKVSSLLPYGTICALSLVYNWPEFLIKITFELSVYVDSFTL